MERKLDGLEDTVASTPRSAGGETSQTRITLDPHEPSTAPTLIAGTEPTGGSATPSERYKLGDVLGRGGMGEVMTARDQQIGRAVAIKRLRGDASESAVARFLREAKIQGRLDHPAIVPVHELCRDEQGRPYFVMKQLAGRTLADVLASTDAVLLDKFNRQTLLRAFVEVCLAVEFAHTRGVLHRDLKPANIMLGDFGEVYVLDWGIARLTGEAAERTSLSELDATDASTIAGAVLGTPGYMSPEQIRGQTDLDGRADVFALGCILFEILTRSPLYPRGTGGLTDALRGADARPTMRAEVAPELDAPCVGATATDRKDRIATARELGELVRRYLDGDRDLELRKTLAKTELDRARTLFDRGAEATVDDRRDAIQAAARALALDPRAPEPAQLVGRLMLEPPRETPPEVAREISKGERVLIANQLRTTNIAMIAYASVFPFSWLIGIDDPVFLTLGPLLLAGICVASWLSWRAVQTEVSYVPYFRAGFACHCALIAVIAHCLTPFLVAPALVAIMLMTFSSHPWIGRPVFLIAGGVLATLGPLVLELTGVLRRTITYTDSTMVLDPSGATVHETLALAGMFAFIIGTVLSAVLLSRSQALERDTLQKRLQVQAWQLRQLVPQ